ncbi:sulfurtransferase [Microbulbifer sp. OS29]|uniref:Sulfurtransferase n=1 Tax=Microbulbifer okhotskensis TaxID=2926617 RepID=A0A9X2J5Z8_9GAMM|nr:sulfurtransferase [Microbulbifer okhotskensis]MCO1335743.1 sulfurtransferase [Microbulbifer okhotskensis]
MDESSDRALLEVADLLALKSTATPVILDCRYNLADPDSGKREYRNGHIPGAYYASLHRDLSAPLQRYGGRHPMPSTAQFQQFARNLGINSDTAVIVYDENRLGFAARAWFLFFFFGHKQVSVLNGGLKAWRNAGETLDTKEAALPLGGNFSAQPKENLLLHYEAVKAGLSKAQWQLLDARDSQRFEGLQEPIDPIAGHIPSAINRPWQDITDKNSDKLKSIAELKVQFDNLAEGRPLLNYCGSGVTACVNFYAQYLAGRRDSLLYPGSWSDWCSHQ